MDISRLSIVDEEKEKIGNVKTDKISAVF